MVPVALDRTAALAATGQDQSGQAGGVDPRLAPAAHEFEASLMQELLKPMERDPLFAGGDGGGLMSSDARAGTWSSLGAQSLAKALSDAGGLGIATKMIAEVEAEAKAKAAGGGHGQDSGAGVRPLGAPREIASCSGARRLS